MGKQTIYSAIDIGTEKISTVIAVLDSDLPRVVGVSSVASKGIKKSQIVGLDDTIEALTESVDSAERMAGLNIKTASISISGVHIESQNSKGVVAVANPEKDISSIDIDRVLEAAQAISLPSGREILHIIPREYKVDSQDGIKDPRGMSGIRLECDAHIITSSGVAIRNIQKCLNELGIQPDKLVFSGLASSHSVLSETEMELGVVLIDIGAGTTSMVVYVEGSPILSRVFPIGARHVTQDIAVGLKISLEGAEQIKRSLRTIFTPQQPVENETREQVRERKKRDDELHLETLGITDGPSVVSKRILMDSIVQARVVELYKLIGKELEQAKLYSMVPAGVVITGGGSELFGIVDLGKSVLNLPVRLGKPEMLRGLTDELTSPQFSTVVGLIKYSGFADRLNSQEADKHGGSSSMINSVINGIQSAQQWLKKLFP